VLYEHFGITSARVVDAARTLVHRAAHRREQPLPGPHRAVQQLNRGLP
jgi:adenylosuccinate lyase